MTRAAWERTITDSAGNVLTGVQIAVFQQDGITPATIYGQLSGGAALNNPFNTGVQTSAKFYADPGRYVIRAVKDSNTKEFTDVDIADKAVRDDLGSGAYLTATTSPTDATPGRALRVGDFGLGGANPVVNDWANMGGHTQFVTMSTPVNAPDDINLGGNWWHVVRMQSNNSPSGALALKTHYTGGYPLPWPELWLQNSAPTGLGFKTRVYSTKNAVGAVEFASGANSGAIIERGANANGEYTKFADGTMICRFTTAAIYGSDTNDTGANLIYSGPIAWNYPANFASTPTCFYTPGPSNFNDAPLTWPTGVVKLGASSPSQGGDNPVFVTFSKMGGTKASVQCLAVGRWR